MITSIPASCSCFTPRPLTKGLGSNVAIIHFFILDLMIRSVQGGVFPWWEHGSKVT